MEMGGNKGSDYESGISWGGKTKKGSAAQIVMAILLVICVIIIIVLAVLLAKKNQDKEDATPSPKIEELQCISKECVEISGSILKSMNLSADPCKDFYEYACGSFDEDPLIPPSYAKYGWFEIITKRVSANSRRVLDEAGNVYKGKESSAIEKVKMIYNVCLNTTATEALGSKALLEWIKELGSWTVTSDEFSGTWQESTFVLERSMAKIYEYAVTPLIKMSLAADLMNNTINRLSFDQPGLSYPSASSYIGSNSEFFEQVQSQYFVDIVTLLGSNQTQAEKIAEEMWNFETELAKIMDKPEDRLDTYKLHNIMTLHDFQDLIDDTKDVFDLGKFLAEVFKEEVPNTKEINVVAPTFFSKLGLVIENTETRTLANYLVWKAIQPVIGVLPKKFQDVASRKESILQGTVGEDPMWQKCVTMAEFAMPEALGALYVDKHFSKEAKLQVKKLVQTMLHQFRQNLPETPWMDSQTKEKAEEKVNAMTYEVGYPDFIEDPTKLDEYYVKLGVMNTNNFDNLRSVLKFRSYTSFLETWGKAPDRSRGVWPAGPTTTNAFYNGQINGMVYSAATLSEPFFSADYPMAMNYGSIGFIIAHEVTHGFDSGGRKLDKYGNLYNWWSNFSNINFVNKAQCMVDQYNEYTEQGHKLNGAITLQENIADNGGLSISYKAYQEWLKENGNSEQGARLPGLGNTENQLFFLAMAQSWCSYYTPQYAIIALSSTHAIDKYRVIGPLSNSPEFAEAYSCPKGSPMNPKSKCKVW